ncbi:PQQ-dependent sugar dehydrogenase [Maritimibacter sp. HL-12]|uniref:PQQ-dependent sugar dehydrogenase n=1 Tax=Maritimibacter sp. HL-12 TaxID=1162418 RepID=UPI000A1CCB52
MMVLIRSRILALAVAVAALAPLPLAAETVETSVGRLQIEEVADGFREPWGLAFLPDDGFLVTERAGALWRVGADGARQRVEGAPEVWARGQGGLLDVMVPRDFSESREVFLSFSKPQPDGAGTALGAGRLNEAGDALEDFRVIFEMTAGGGRGQHFGSRIVEAPDGHLFLTIGDRGAAERAQDNAHHNGTVVRIARDGAVPDDNPFVGVEDAQPEIWSYGHRNAQGAALGPEGGLWLVEHGAMGGDEVNRVEPGANYGWPEISYGRNYDGSKIGVGTEAEGMKQPVHYWDPSIAPSGLAVYSGALWPEWEGRMIVGSLKFDYIAVLDPETGNEEALRSRESARVRDVREAPDGSIWFLSVGQGGVFRIIPAR